MKRRFTVVDLETGKMVSDEMTIDEFKNWFTGSVRYNKWAESRHYDETYAQKKMGRELSVVSDYSFFQKKEVDWNSYRFIPI